MKNWSKYIHLLESYKLLFTYNRICIVFMITFNGIDICFGFFLARYGLGDRILFYTTSQQSWSGLFWKIWIFSQFFLKVSLVSFAYLKFVSSFQLAFPEFFRVLYLLSSRVLLLCWCVDNKFDKKVCYRVKFIFTVIKPPKVL